MASLHGMIAPEPAFNDIAAFWRRPNPLLGLAAIAGAGILVADLVDPAPWTALGGFLFVALAWAARRRIEFLWLTVAVGFATLHAFSIHSLPAEALARQLTAGPTDPAVPVRALGRVIDEPRYSATGATARFTLGLERVEIAGQWARSQARVEAEWQNGAPACGDELELIGAARNLAGPRNPGEFDFADHERRQGILSEIRCRGLNDVRVVSRDQRASLRQTALRFHDWLRDSLHLGLESGTPAASVVATMLLGLRDDPGLGDLEEVFQRTGTLHYFAIDGLKLALLSCLALALLQRAGVPRGWARTLSLPPLVFYAMATGLGPASVRATLMAAMLLGAFWIERPPRPLNLLGGAAALILVYDTNQLFDLGFQLTFLVVLAVLTLAGPLQRRLAVIGASDPFLPPRLYTRLRKSWEVVRPWAWGLVSVSLVAWLGSLPIMILRFHVVSPISPLANVVTFPLAWAVLTLGVAVLCAASVGTVVPGGGAVAIGFNHLNFVMAKALLATVHLFDSVPGGSFYVAAPAGWTLRGSPAVELTVLDLGVPRAMHLRAGGADWLIDAAQPFEYQRSIRPYLHYRGINRLNGLILSQPDTHHVGGAALAWEDFAVPRVVDSSGSPDRSPRRQEFLRLLSARQQKPEILTAGGSLALGAGVELKALYPPAGLKAGGASDRALVLQLRAANSRILLMADGGEVTQRWLLEHVSAADLRSDVMITGAFDPPLPEFSQAVAPRLTLSQSLAGDPATMSTRNSGAITLQVWPDRLEARGFADGAARTIKAFPTTR